MKTVWIINHYATPPSFGGLTRHHFLAKNISNTYSVKIIAASAIHNSKINMINDKSKYLESNIDGVDYIHVRTRQYKSKISRVLNMLEYYFRTKKVLKKISKPDYIYASIPQPLSALIAIKLAKKYKVPCIIETRDLWPETIISFGILKKNCIIAKMLYQLEKYIYVNADKIVFTMEGGKEYLKERKYANKIDFKHVYHLNNGADLFKVKDNLKKYSIKDSDLDDDNTFKIVYTGSIRYAYNINKIVELAKMFQDNNLSDIKFLIYGDGPYRNDLIKLCKDENINNIVFKGFVDVKYIPYIMSKCDLALLHGANHSVFRYGTSQNKMFTYLASGKPIISTFPNEYDMISKNKCGETVQSDSIDEYYEKILKIYNASIDKYNKYCENSRKLAKKYDYMVLSKKLIEIIKD